MDGTLPRGPAPSKKPFGFKNKHTKKQKKAAPKINSSITINDFAEGCITFGSIRSVEDDALYIDLPGGHRGILLFTEVNEYFLQQLQMAVEENQTSFNTLTEFFKVGSFIMAVVLSAGTNPVELSIRPSLINIGMPIKKNSIFYAAIKSEEDKGYIIDIGRKGYLCFLPFNGPDGKKRNLKVGQPVYVRIIKADENSNNLTFDLIDTETSFPTVIESAPQFDEIRPFTVIDSVVKTNPPSGALKLQVGGIFSGVCPKFSWPAGKNQGDHVNARPLLIDPAQKLLWMSAIPTIVDGLRPACYDVKLGEIIDAEVLRIRSGVGIECILKRNGKDIRIFIDFATTEAESTIAAGDIHRVRIIERRPIDDLLFAADDKETLNLQVFSVEDAEVGKVYDGTVVQVHPKFGVFVKISKFLTGLAPLAYCDDPDKLEKGSEVKAIVLSKSNGQLKLALKEKLINSHYLRILSLDDVRHLIANRELYEQAKSELNDAQGNENEENQPNDEIDVLSLESTNKPEEPEEIRKIRKSQYTHVIVKKVVKSGMIVEMFNGLVAMIPAQYLPIQPGSDVSKIYQVGHVLRARVVTLDGDKINCSVTATDEKILQLGLELSVKVIGFTSDAVQVQLPSQYGQFKAIIPNTHFSDNLNLSQRIRDSLSTGKKLRKCILVRLPGFSAPAVLTRKQCFKQNASSIPRSNLEISPSNAYFGYVSGTQKYGSFVSFFGRASGLIHNQKLKIGESVNAYVQKMEKQNVSLTLPAEYGESDTYLQNFLYDVHHNFRPPAELVPNESSTLIFTVSEPAEALGDNFVYNINSEWKGISSINVDVGGQLQVAYCDYISNVAILDNFKEGLVEIEAGDTINATVLALVEPIIVAKYKDHIFLAPMNNYNNHQDYSNIVKTGETISLIASNLESYRGLKLTVNTATPSYLLSNDTIQKVKAEILSIDNLYAHVQLSDGRKGRIHRSQIPNTTKPGEIIQGQILSDNEPIYIVTDPLSPQHPEDFKEGMKVTGFVTHVYDDSLRLSLSPYTNGVIDAMHLTTSDRKLISENLQNNFSIGDPIEGYVVGTIGQSIQLSVQNPEENNTVHFAKVLHIKPGDYAEVKIGMKDRRYLDVFDVSDEFKFNPLRQFKEGQVIDVAFIPDDDKHVSTRPSAFEGIFPEVKEIEVGQIYKGYVSHHSEQGKFILVRLARGVTGKLSRNKIADTYIKDPQELFPDGSVITVKVESITNDNGVKVINLTSRHSDLEGKLLTFEDMKVGDILNGYISGVNEHGVYVNLLDFHKLSGLVHRSNLDERDPSEWEAFKNSRVKVEVEAIDQEKKKVNLKFVEDPQKEVVESSSSSSSDDDETDENVQLNEIDLDFDENKDENDDTEVIQRKLKLTEEEIAQLEANQLKPTAPKTLKDFDLMLSKLPKSSYLWVKFIEFHFANGDIEEAKKTAKRALDELPIGDRQEKINVFISYINLMVLTAKKESFIDELMPLVRQAAASTNQIRIWTHFGVFVSAQRPEFEKEVWNRALKQCKGSVEVWAKYLETLMNEGKSQLAREELKRGFQSFDDMKSDDRWKLKERFGICEFRNGNIEHGRTVFEDLIKNNENKAHQFDYWNIYVDMETKYGDVDHARNIYDRLANTKLKPDRMRSTLKKWLNFESTHGDDPQRKAHIKKIAVEYSARKID